MKNVSVFVFTLFLLLVSCVFYGQNNQKEYSVTLKRLESTILITYKLDSSYKELNPGLALWNAENAKKYKKNQDLLIRFYDMSKSTGVNEEFLKIFAKHEVEKYGISDNPFSTVDEYSTNFNSQKGYFIKSKSENSFILSYYTFNNECKTSVMSTLEGENLKNEDELAFKELIKSFTFKK